MPWQVIWGKYTTVFKCTGNRDRQQNGTGRLCICCDQRRTNGWPRLHRTGVCGWCTGSRNRAAVIRFKTIYSRRIDPTGVERSGCFLSEQTGPESGRYQRKRRQNQYKGNCFFRVVTKI